MGTMSILNVAEGDTKLVFDPSNPMETLRSGKIITDMLRRGYALFVEVGKDDQGRPMYTRVKEFDETKGEYIIADGPAASPATATVSTHTLVGTSSPPEPSDAPVEASEPAVSKAKKGTRRVKATDAEGVAVARTAGG